MYKPPAERRLFAYVQTETSVYACKTNK